MNIPTNKDDWKWEKRKYAKTMKEDQRYPYTYACDYIRSLAGYNKYGTKISRSDASNILSSIAEIIGWDDEAFAMKIADYYKKKENL